MENHEHPKEELAPVSVSPDTTGLVETTGLVNEYSVAAVPTAFAEELLPVHLNQPLIESTRRLKEERDLVRTRFEKMERHRGEVSDIVYGKVRGDYVAKYRELAEAHSHKKEAIDAELEKLYEASRELSQVLEKHRVELEEAKFRHFLGEYADQRYKAVEKKEEKEIYKHEQILEKLQEYIDTYEALVVANDEPPFMEPVLAKSEKVAAPVKTEKKSRVVDDDKTRVAAVLKDETAVKEPKAQAKAEKENASSGINLLKRAGPSPKTESDLFAREPSLSREGEFAQKTGRYATGRYATPQQEEAHPVAKKKEQGPFVQEEESIADILNSIPLEAQAASRSAPETEERTPVAASSAKLTVLETGGEPIAFTELEIGKAAYLGRLPSNEVVLPSAKVSRRHAQIASRDGEYVIVDLDSSNGVLVNGSRAKESLLRSGDTIGIGRYRLRFELDG